MIAATVVLQALLVGAVSFVAIRGIWFSIEHELDDAIFKHNEKIASAYVDELSQALVSREVLADGTSGVPAVAPPDWAMGNDAVSPWFENLRTRLKRVNLTNVGLSTKVAAYMVTNERLVYPNGETKETPAEIYDVAVTPESKLTPLVWRQVLESALQARASSMTLPTSSPMTRKVRMPAESGDDQADSTAAVSVMAFPVWRWTTPEKREGVDAYRTGWVVVMSKNEIDQLTSGTHTIFNTLTWWFVSTAALLIVASVLATMIFARRYDTKIHQMNDDLERAAQDSSRRALQIRNGMIFGLAKLADYRDTDTGQHLERISQYCAMLAHELMDDFPEINQAWIEKLRVASSMHDIGKVGIPDYILLKPGALTATERKIMENHPIIGADTLIAIRRRSGDDELLNIAIQVTLSHHERYDGKGYPFGLSRDQIPLAARIVALSDMYDALTSKRVYKAAMSHEEAKRIIREGSGTQFDPKIVNAFIRIQRKFDDTRREMAHDDGAIPHAKTPPLNDVPGPDVLPAPPTPATPERRAA